MALFPPHPAEASGSDAAARAEAAERNGDLLRAIQLLDRAVHLGAPAEAEYRMVELRHRAFACLDVTAGFPTWPPRAPSSESDGVLGSVPTIERSQLTSDRLRINLLAHGCLHVRGVLNAFTVEQLVGGIDRALEEWASLRRPYARRTGSPWFDPLAVDEPERSALGRKWVNNSGGLLTADSPRMLFLLLDALEAAGLRTVVSDYLGERPAFSANKCTIRRVPVDSDAGWHQDGAFLGGDVRALNIWLALTPCGTDAPGLDVLPRRLDHLVETGSHGSYFDWAVGADLVRELARETPIVRPQFEAGDALIFDDLFLHRTAVDPSMTRCRHAVETWCFAPSAYPRGHVPIVW